MAGKPLSEAEFAFANIFEVLVDVILATGVPPKALSDLLDERANEQLRDFPEALALVTSLSAYAQERKETLDRIRALIAAAAKGRA